MNHGVIYQCCTDSTKDLERYDNRNRGKTNSVKNPSFECKKKMVEEKFVPTETMEELVFLFFIGLKHL